MSKQCYICGANHQKLGIKSCNTNKCIGETFYHIIFKDYTIVMYDTRYDGSWNWGIVLNPMNAVYYTEYDNVWILTTNGENIIYWSRKYDYNFNKLFSAYSVISYSKKNKNNKKITSDLYSINVNKVLICDLNFYLINKDRCHIDSKLIYSDYKPPEGGISMYALVIIQCYWLKSLEAKKHNKKYRNYIYRILKDDVTKNINCLINIIKYV